MSGIARSFICLALALPAAGAASRAGEAGSQKLAKLPVNE
jgi:hypothetical protein